MTEKLGDRTDIAEKIVPTNFGVGCRRPTVCGAHTPLFGQRLTINQPGNGFLESLTLPNITTYTKEMKRITPKGFINADGNEVEIDVIICATG